MVDEVSRRREAFIRWKEANKLSIAAINRASKVPESTIRSYINGQSNSLKGTTQDLITSAYGVTTAEVFGDALPLPKVGVFGRIGAKADVFPADTDGDDPVYETELPVTLDPAEEYIGFEIDGFSMPPAEPGWVVIFLRKEVALDDLVNFPCMVQLEDGRRLFKRLRRGYAEGRWNLESWDGSPLIEDVLIQHALPFAAMTPGRTARK